MKYDVIVIGGGILGCFHAYHSLKKGKSVLLIERNSKSMEASVRNFGHAVASGLSLNEWHRYGVRSQEIFAEIAQKAALPIRNEGSTYVANTPGEFAVLEEMMSKFSELNYPSQLLDKSEVLKKIPVLKSEYAIGALFFPKELTVESNFLIDTIREFMVEQMGLQQTMNTLVLDVEESNDGIHVVTHRKERFKAEKVIVCSGREFQILFPEVFSKSDLETCRLQMMSIKNPGVQLPGNILTGLTIRRYESFKAATALKTIDAHGVSSELDQNGIHILFKQRPDGSIIIGDSHEYRDAADAHNMDYHQNTHLDNLMLSEARRIMNFEKWDVEYTWSGYYSQCKNGDVFEQTPISNVHIVTGIGGKGMTSSAGYAEANIEKWFA